MHSDVHANDERPSLSHCLDVLGRRNGRNWSQKVLSFLVLLRMACTVRVASQRSSGRRLFTCHAATPPRALSRFSRSSCLRSSYGGSVTAGIASAWVRLPVRIDPGKSRVLVRPRSDSLPLRQTAPRSTPYPACR